MNGKLYFTIITIIINQQKKQLSLCPLFVSQLKGSSQEPKAKKSRRSQMVEPKEEASVSH